MKKTYYYEIYKQKLIKFFNIYISSSIYIKNINEFASI